MKAIIHGVRYDTDKAIEVGEASGGSEFVTDFSHWSAKLYRTPRSGRYFIAGSGGPMTMFSRTVGQNEWTGGSAIIPFEDETAAFEWAQNHLDADVVEEHFSHLIEDA